MFKFLKYLLFIVIILSSILVGFSFNEEYYLIEFDGVILNTDKLVLSDKGVNFIDYYSNYTFLVKFDSSLFDEILELKFINSIKLFKNGNSINIINSDFNSNSIFNFRNLDFSEKLKYHLEVIDNKFLDNISDKIISMGGIILNVSEKNILFELSELKVLELLEVYEILNIELYEFPESFNNQGKDKLNVNYYFENFNLFGEGQVVGVADTGLDTGNINSIHDDFKDKNISLNEVYVGPYYYDGPMDKNSGHGTHVTGSFVGTGVNSGANLENKDFIGSNSGTAPLADLYFQALEFNYKGNYVLGVPSNLYYLFKPAYDYGVRVHSNSWGNDKSLSMYLMDSKNIDNFVWDYKDFTILFAAGNYGLSSKTLTRQASSKNAISVGAVNADWNVAGFSSRGPVNDGRIKPDVVTLGRGIVSTLSSIVSSSQYGSKSGTSMATPLVAGIVTLIRENLIKNENISNPSASLIKASLINGARDSGPVGPDYNYGFGFADLAGSINQSGDREIIFYENDTGIFTDESFEYEFMINDINADLKLTLVWSDYPSVVGANLNLVNDLDFILILPNGEEVYGNDLNKFLEFDRINNVEQIIIKKENLIIGDYVVKIKGFNIPYGPQPFSFVISKFNAPIMPIEFDYFTNLKLHDRLFNDSLDFNISINFSKNISYLEYFNGVEIFDLSSEIMDNKLNVKLNLSDKNNISEIWFKFIDFEEQEDIILLNMSYYEKNNFTLEFSYFTNLKLQDRLVNDSLYFNILINFSDGINYLEYFNGAEVFNLRSEVIDNKLNVGLNLSDNNNISQIWFNFSDLYNQNYSILLNLSFLKNNKTSYEEDLINRIEGLVGDFLKVDSNFENLSFRFENNNTFIFSSLDKKVIEFYDNLSINELNLSKIKIKKDSSGNLSKMFVSGLDLSENFTKTVYLDLIESGENNSGICLSDNIVNSFNFNLSCDGENEYYVNSFPYFNEKYNVSKINSSRVKVSGLSHSAVYQMCSESWDYGNWSSCENSIQVRSAFDLNSCSSELSKEIVSRSCVMPPVSVSVKSSSGRGKGGWSGDGEEIKTQTIISEVEKGNIVLLDKEFSNFKVVSNLSNITSEVKFNTLKKLNLISEGIELMSFNFDFSYSNLNLEDVSVESGNLDSGASYIIISGVSKLVINEKIYLKNNFNSDKICIKNSMKIDSVDNFSLNCDEFDEFVLECSENYDSGVKCVIIEDYYVISGLINGGVIELGSKFNGEFFGSLSGAVTYNMVNQPINVKKKTSKKSISKEIKFEFYLSLFLLSCLFVFKIFKSINSEKSSNNNFLIKKGLREYISRSKSVGIGKEHLLRTLEHYYDKKALLALNTVIDEEYLDEEKGEKK